MSIEQADMLHGVSAADAARLAALGSRVTIPTGAPLFDLGTEAGDVFLIERGRVALTLPMRIGSRHEDVLVEERTAGQMVGWSGLIPPHRFTLKASAQIDTDVLALGCSVAKKTFAGIIFYQKNILSRALPRPALVSNRLRVGRDFAENILVVPGRT